MKAKNARFWTWENGGWIKLTLKPGQTLEHHTGGPHDEGWSFTTQVWEYDGEIVECSYSTESRDCDGRHGNYGQHHCHVDDLRACERITDHGWIVPVPSWIPGDSSQYDQYAEMAGY